MVTLLGAAVLVAVWSPPGDAPGNVTAAETVQTESVSWWNPGSWSRRRGHSGNHHGPRTPPATTPPATTPPGTTPPATTPPATTPPGTTPPADHQHPTPSGPPSASVPGTTPPASTPPTDHVHPTPPPNNLPVIPPPSTTYGPRPATTGRFIVHCQPTVRGQEDPIVFPGQRNASHMHDFYGPTKVKAAGLTSELAEVATSCSSDLDRSAYWVPTVYKGDNPVRPQRIQAYYVTDSMTVATPRGLAILAGKPTTTALDSVRLAWRCAGGGHDRRFATAPAECEPKESVSVEINFPGCWDGKNLDSSDHASHMAYADSSGRCPVSHAVHVPQLILFLSFWWNETPGAQSTIRLASGPSGSMHADFVSGWDPAAQLAIINQCRAVACPGPQGTEKPSPRGDLTPLG